MELPIYVVDAFTSRIFGGNPAAVCPLTSWLDDATLQAIAAENNLSETAYFVPEGDGFHLRWFTPGVEIDLCGHATLASAFVLSEFLEPGRTDVRFRTMSGNLFVHREGDLFTLDFPARPPVRIESIPAEIADALGRPPAELWAARDYMAVFHAEDDVRSLRPDLRKVAALDKFAMIVTAPGTSCDFVSRFFAPAKGVDEDPVTGSAHCTLTPYWAQRLGKNTLNARQVSRRGGELLCELTGDRVRLSGRAVLYSTGRLHLTTLAAQAAR